MWKTAAAILSPIIGGVIAAVACVSYLSWGVSTAGETVHSDAQRSDYVDLLLTVATLFLGLIGLAVTIGALVIGLVALKTLREIKDEAARDAKKAAAEKISATMAKDLQPNVNARVREILPEALSSALLQDDLAHNVLSEMAKRGELDEVIERVAMRTQGVEPEPDIEADQYQEG